MTQTLLDDEKTYEKLDKDPIKKNTNMLKNLKNVGKINVGQCKHLYPTAENVPRIYSTPNIHKPDVPLRPIVDYTGSIWYATSRLLSDILAPLVGNTPQHIKNSQHISEEVSEMLIEENEIFTIVEDMPSFPGGEAELFKYLGKSIKYPKMASEADISGIVYMTFVVGKDGSIKDVKVMRGIGAGCDEEAIRAVKNMPKWKPGKQRGRAVEVQYNLPVRFTLSRG